MTLLRHVSHCITHGIRTHGTSGHSASGDPARTVSRSAFLLPLLLAALAVTGFSARPANANTIYVSPNGSDTTGDGSQRNPYQSIALALNNVNPNDTVDLEPGTYSGATNSGDQNLSASVNFTLTSTGGANSTFIDCSNAPAFVFAASGNTGPTVTIKNVTIENGAGAGNIGGGVEVGANCTVTLANCALSGNSGGGVVNAGTLALTNCTFNGNVASSLTAGAAGSNGGGLINSGTATVSGGAFINNNAGSGGAIYNSGTLTVLGGTSFSGNTASGSGGGVCNISTAILEDCTFTSNAAAATGGAIFNTDTLTLQNGALQTGVALTTNSAGTTGGGIQNAGSATVSNTMFNGNTALAGGGGGLYDAATGGVANVTYQGMLTNCTFVSNSGAGGNGGGIDSGSALTAVNCTFTNNSVSGTGAKGGAVESDGAGTLVNDILYGNSAPSAATAEIGSGTTAPTVDYSDVQGGFHGTNNINANPEFIYTPGSSGEMYGDLHLQPTYSPTASPCLGAGVQQITANGQTITAPLTTIDNQTRPNPPSIGAYEAGTYYPPPTITSITASTGGTPSSYVYVNTAFTLTVNGTNFVPGINGTTLTFNGNMFTSADFITDTSTTLSVNIPAGDNNVANAADTVEVANPSPPADNFVDGTIAVVNPTPAINPNGLSPNPATAGSSFTLTVTGTGFNSGTYITYGGATLYPTTTPTSTQLSVTIPRADNTAANASGVPVVVINPGPTVNGANASASSNTEDELVNNPSPGAITLSPTSSVFGTPFTLTITGTGFIAASSSDTGTSVTFDGTVLSNVSVNASGTTLTVPVLNSDYTTPSGPVTVTVTNPAPGGGSASASFTVNARVPAPTITGVSPASAVVGQGISSLVVTGTNFNSNTTLTFTDGSASTTPTITNQTATQLTATVPASAVTTAGAATVTVTNPPTTTTPTPDGGSATNSSLIVDNPVPAIASANGLSPSSAIVGTSFTLVVTGSGFDSATTLTFGSAPLTITSESPLQLVATVPALANNTVGPVTVTVTNPAPTTNGANASASATFTVNSTNAAPTIASLSPSSALVNTSFMLTVNGANFLPSTTLKFNGVPLTIASQSATTLTVTVPAQDNDISGAIPVVITNPAPGGGSATSDFTVTTPPALTISSISPQSVTVDTGFTLTVTGTDFTSNTALLFGGTVLTINGPESSSTQLVATVPSSLNGTIGTVTVKASNSVTNYATATITVNQANTTPAPTVTNLSPATATVGTSFTLTVAGTNFTSGSTLQFGTTTLAITSQTATQIVAAVPASANAATGSVTVTVTTPGGSATGTFTVNATNPVPTITSVAPASATTGSGFTLTVTGSNFTSGTTLTFGGTALTITRQTSTTLTAAVPASANGATGSIPVVVTNPTPGGGSANSEVTVSSALATLHSFSAGLQMITLPENYVGVSSLADVWSAGSGELLDTWDGGPNYVTITVTSPAQLPTPGVGVWADFGQATTLYDTGVAASTAGSYSVSLAQGWNMVGNPFTTAVPENGLEVTAGAGMLTLSEANTEALVSSTVYTYQPGDSAYEAINLPSGTINAFAGYWVYAFQPCSLVFPAPSASAVRARR